MIKFHIDKKGYKVTTICYQNKHRGSSGGCANIAGLCECECHIILKCPRCGSDNIQDLDGKQTCRDCNKVFINKELKKKRDSAIMPCSAKSG